MWALWVYAGMLAAGVALVVAALRDPERGRRAMLRSGRNPYTSENLGPLTQGRAADPADPLAQGRAAPATPARTRPPSAVLGLMAALMLLYGVPRRVIAQPQLPVVDGWTVFTASPDTRQVFVSPSGSDANTGLSPAFPKATIAAGAALLRDGFPDWLLLESGAAWAEAGGFPAWGKGGRSALEPMRIGVYGGPARARVTVHGQAFGGLVFGAAPKSHLAVSSVALVAGNPGASTSAGVSLLGSWTDVLLEDVLVAGFHTNIVFQSDRTIQTMGGIRLRRCVVLDACTTGSGNSEGAFFAGIDGLLLEECVFDHNGWSESIAGAAPNIFRHNVYIQGHGGAGPGSNYDDCTHVVTRGLIASRGAATGMQQRPGGLCDNSLFLHNPLNLVFGTYGGTARDCVVVGSRDIDAGTPRGVGFNLVSPDGPKVVQRCLAVGLPSPMGTGNVYAYAVDGAPSVTLEGCVSWRWTSAAGAGSAVHASNAPMPAVTGGNMEQVPPAYEVSLAAYAGGESAWWAGIRAQSRATWNPAYTAAAFNDWARAAFGMAGGACYVDFNRNGTADVGDFAAYLAAFAGGEPAANCDGSTQEPRENVADFTCFLQKYAAGCP